MPFFSINNIAFTILGYPLSWVELLATVFTLACVGLAVRRNILNWPVGLVAIILSCLVFYQTQLYADCFLQLYFFITSVYGWWFWNKQKPLDKEQPVSFLTGLERVYWTLGIIAGWMIISFLIMHLNEWLPLYFPQPAAFPVPDSFIMVASIAGQWLLAKKKLENWYCWIGVNSTAMIVYYQKDIKLFSLLYLILLIMAFIGSRSWKRERTGT